jgi:transposase
MFTRKRYPGHNLLLRLRDYRCDVLRFLYDPTIPLTNNQAEQDLRMMKLKQKISGGFRTTNGAEVFIRIRTFLSTARKQGWDIFNTLANSINGEIPLPIS